MMSGLVKYGSSDEEGDGDSRSTNLQPVAASTSSRENGTHATKWSETPFGNPHGTNTTTDRTVAAASQTDVLENTMIGPQVPPEARLDGDVLASPLSPYSANRAALRNLTLPTMVDLNLPPSPPGSPPPEMMQKFEHFMRLKQQGVHFNEKLAASSALKNPSLLPKLMSSAGLADSDQYGTTLSKDIWDPSAFPDWAYKEELAKSQQSITRRKEEENTRTQRDSINFVSATGEAKPDFGVSSSFTLGSKGGRASSAAERVAAGLDQDILRPSQRTDQGLRRGLERRNGRQET
ncbi:MAG: hypothetical protein Q9186_003596 [Xanthomendoza sp. 1 TL-2023]